MRQSFDVKTKVTLMCPTCDYRARRRLLLEPGSRGTHETCSEPALCPHGHGDLVRVDGNSNVHSKLLKP